MGQLTRRRAHIAAGTTPPEGAPYSVSNAALFPKMGVLVYAGDSSVQELLQSSAGRALGCRPGLSRIQRLFFSYQAAINGC